MKNKVNSEFNKTKVYKDQIEEYVRKIRCICNQNHIPYFMSFGVALGEDGQYHVPGGLISSVLLPETLHIPSNDPKFARMVNVVNGFRTVVDKDVAMNIDDPMFALKKENDED